MIEVIKFGADWCAPCRAIAPIIQSLKEKYDAIEGSTVSIMEMNIDFNSELAAEYSIRSIPTIVFIKDGEIKEKKIGLLSEAQIEEIIKTLK